MKNLSEIVKTEGPQSVISIGYNMKCNHCITKSVLSFENGQFICKNGGIRMLAEDISGFYLDTKENRKFLNLTK